MKRLNLTLPLAVLAIAAVFNACGEMAVDGLKPGEQRLVPLPHNEEPTSSTSFRIFKGEIDETVTIAPGEQVMFLGDEANAAAAAGPVFLKPVTVGAGANLRGVATFNARLTIEGTRERPVVWAPGERGAVAVAHTEWDWLIFSGGDLRIGAITGKISTVHNTRFVSSKAAINLNSNGLVEIAWTEFFGTQVKAIVAAPDRRRGRGVRILSNIFEKSALAIEGNESAAAFEISGNNFLGIGDSSFYLSSLAPSLIGHLIGGNFFAVKERFLKPSDGNNDDDFSLRGVTDWISRPFRAGPDSLEPGAAPTYRPGEIRLIHQNSTNAYLKDPEGRWLGSWRMWSFLGSSLGDELMRYSFADHLPATTVLVVEIGSPQGCEAGQWPEEFYCAGSYSIEASLELQVAGESVTRKSISLALDSAEGAHAERRFRQAAMTLVSDLADARILVGIPSTYTPYW